MLLNKQGHREKTIYPTEWSVRHNIDYCKKKFSKGGDYELKNIIPQCYTLIFLLIQMKKASLENIEKFTHINVLLLKYYNCNKVCMGVNLLRFQSKTVYDWV